MPPAHRPDPPGAASRAGAAALRYAALGWPVLPLHTPRPGGGCTCQRRGECGQAGKHPRIARGLHAATTDLSRIDRWWGRWPAANVAVVTGARSGLLVVDVDGEAGERTLAELEAAHAPLPATRAQRTGAGRHLLFAHPGRPVPNSAGKLGSGVDVRGDGGFIVAAPSRHATGVLYAWRQPVAPVAAAPGWLLALLDPPAPAPPAAVAVPVGEGVRSRYVRAALVREADRVRVARPGARNATLNAAAFALGTLAGVGDLTAADVHAVLRPAAAVAGLGQREARATIASGLRAGAARPRQARP